MKMKINKYLVLLLSISIAFLGVQELRAKIDNNSDRRNSFIGSAYSENESYKILEKICKEYGGRLAGSASSQKTIQLLSNELASNNIFYQIDKFTIPGWQRGKANYIKLLHPLKKDIIGYTIGSSPAIDKSILDVEYANAGFTEEYLKINAKDKAIIIDLDNAASGNNLTRSQAIKIAKDNGANAVLFSGNKDSSMVLMSAGSFDGASTGIPAFAISKYDSELLKNSIINNENPKVEIYSTDTLRDINLQNLRAIFPGKSTKKVVLMAHYDSWDISQGAVDNGIGIAILIDVAKLIKKYYPNNLYTIECIWTDGEEIGLHGAKKLFDKIKDSTIAVINVDMTGSPTGINVMGYESMINFSENFINSLPGYIWNDGVKNYPWLRSDHAPFLTYGIPSFTFNAYNDQKMYKHYHSIGDNFELINPRYISDAVAIIGLFTVELANFKDIEKHKLNKQSTIKMLKKHKLDLQLKKTGEWKED